MRSYLIVANRTLGSPSLAAAITERLASGPARFHVVVPASPAGAGFSWDEDRSRAEAQVRLDAMVAELARLHAEATGEVGAPDPVDAAADALREGPVDEIILSTLPSGVSRWLGMDVPSRLRDVARGVPVIVITAPRGA
jgi:hypothetical protein